MELHLRRSHGCYSRTYFSLQGGRARGKRQRDAGLQPLQPPLQPLGPLGNVNFSSRRKPLLRNNVVGFRGSLSIFPHDQLSTNNSGVSPRISQPLLAYHLHICHMALPSITLRT